MKTPSDLCLPSSLSHKISVLLYASHFAHKSQYFPALKTTQMQHKKTSPFFCETSEKPFEVMCGGMLTKLASAFTSIGFNIFDPTLEANKSSLRNQWCLEPTCDEKKWGQMKK